MRMSREQQMQKLDNVLRDLGHVRRCLDEDGDGDIRDEIETAERHVEWAYRYLDAANKGLE